MARVSDACRKVSLERSDPADQFRVETFPSASQFFAAFQFPMNNFYLVYIGRDQNDVQAYARVLSFSQLTVEEASEREFGVDDVVIITSGTTPYHADMHNPEIQRVVSLVKQLVEGGVRLLAIGVGMSALALAFGGEVEDHSEREEAGVIEVHRLAPAEGDPVFGDAPETFAAVAYRHDDIMQLPIEFVPLANSKMAQFQAVKVAGKPVYGLQFDPLLSLVDRTLSEFEHNNRERFEVLLSTLLLGAKS